MSAQLAFYIALGVILLSSCEGESSKKNATDQIKESPPADMQPVAKELKKLTFEDFKSIKGVASVQDVPFFVYSKLDSLHFFAQPDKHAASMKVKNEVLNNYYGFKELEDFYLLHFSVENNLSQSKAVYVLKSEFTAAYKLTLAGVNLQEIRSSTLHGVDDFEIKSFTKFGHIEEISAEAFAMASKHKITYNFQKNPALKFDGKAWSKDSPKSSGFRILQKEDIYEEGVVTRQYSGSFPPLNAEIFLEKLAHDQYVNYSFYDMEQRDIVFYATGFPHVHSAKQWISYIQNNSDVGSDFCIKEYTGKSLQERPLLYVNFTNFKIKDSGVKAFWTDDYTFYVEVFHINARPSLEGKQQTAYLKISLKKELL